MAIDQRDVSSTLRFMDDRALQQYAAMHKNDPYIFPLAFQESQNRQKLRMSQQAQMAQQPQPKVAEQALAQMAPQPMPEEMGIGALPAGNMEGMADGGIVGYEGYDETPRQFSQEPVMMMAEGGVARYQAGGSVAAKYQQESQEMVSGNRVQYSPDVAAYAAQLANEERAAAQAGEQAFLRQEQQRMLRGPYGTPPVAQQPSPTDANFRRQPDPRMMGIAATAQPLITSEAAPEVVAAPKADTGRMQPTAGPRREAAPVVPEQTAAQRYAAMQKGSEPEREEIDKGIAALAASKRKAVTDELSEFEKDVAERGVAFKGREERLAKREGELGKRKDETAGLALLEAGLAIMSTPGSLATAIGKGAQTGLKTYSAGLKDLRAAQEKMDDARDQIEEFRRNEANMTAKERRQYKSAIGRTENEIEQLSLNAAEKMYGYKRDDVKAIFTADTQERLTDKEIKSREKIAREAAGRNPQLETMRALQADPKLMETYKAMQGKGEDVMGQYNDFLKANPTLALDPKAAFTQFLMTKSAFQQLGKPTVTDTPSTKVRTQP